MPLDDWVRVGQVAFLGITAVVYMITAATTLWRLHRRTSRITALERQITTGRVIRHAALVFFMLGAIYALIARWGDPLTLRSLCWALGCTCAWIAWVMLDRRRWETGLT